MRLIDADALQVAHIPCPENISVWAYMEMVSRFSSLIDDQRTIYEVKLIRCKDCRWFTGGMLGGMSGACNHKDWKFHGEAKTMSPYGFCSRAERKQEMIEEGPCHDWEAPDAES